MSQKLVLFLSQETNSGFISVKKAGATRWCSQIDAFADLIKKKDAILKFELNTLTVEELNQIEYFLPLFEKIKTHIYSMEKAADQNDLSHILNNLTEIYETIMNSPLISKETRESTDFKTILTTFPTFISSGGRLLLAGQLFYHVGLDITNDSLISRILDAMAEFNIDPVATAGEVEAFISHILDNIKSDNVYVLPDGSALYSFWQDRKTDFPNLYSVAMKLFHFRGNSCSLERVFAIAGQF